MDTDGFYKIDSSGSVLFAPNEVAGPGYTYTRQTRKTTPAANGWVWFDSVDAAQVALGFSNSDREALFPQHGDSPPDVRA